MTQTARPRSPAFPPAVPPLPVRRFTPDEYDRMVRKGILGEDDRVELLEGWIVPMSPRYAPHDCCIDLVHHAIAAVLTKAWYVRLQSGTATRDSRPEPDLAVVRGPERRYREHHPGPDDIAFVVEVSDSTLRIDRGLKQRVYARAGIPVYWIVNLKAATVEVYTDPTGPSDKPGYGTRKDFRAGESVPVVIDGREVGCVAVADLLP